MTDHQDPLAVACLHVSKTYTLRDSSVPALVDVSMQVFVGQITAVFGPSGSGKSTLLRLLSAVDRPDEGQVLYGDISTGELSARRRRRLRRHTISYVFQEPGQNLIGYLNARDHLVLAGQLRGSALDGIDALLDSVGLGNRADHLPDELSGGEQQRLAVAAAVMGEPLLVLGDELTAELDRASGARLLSSIVDLVRAGTTFVIASHDPTVREIADVVVELQNGRVTS
ncbi:MAG: ATP-binding cassette domain-containing protein [Acidimicrobiales bacterium]